jgi:RNA polymerase sigma factor (sigma-70 family)
MPAIALSLLALRADRMSFDSLYEAHRDSVHRLCLRYGGGRAGWAEDVTHDVFVKLLEHLDRLDAHEDVGGWLYRVATNLCISRLRRDRSVLSWLGGATREPEPAAAAEALLADRESARAALATLATLPPRERAVLCMKVLDGLEQREIAQVLDLSEGYVSKLLARAWGQVRAAGWEGDDEQA